MSNNSPLVSVSITSYNQRDALIRAIDSVLNQTYPNIQIVIADDCSKKDDSQDVIYDYKKRYGEQIKPIFQKENIGIAKNKNSGFAACEGNYITYLDGDDFYYPEKIQNEIAIFKIQPNTSIVYSNFAHTDINGNIKSIWAKPDWNPIEGNAFKYVYARLFPQRTLYRCELMKKEVMKSIGYYDENLIAYEDWDSRIRMTKKYNIAYSNYIGSAYVDDPMGISKTEKKEKLLKEMMFVYKKNKTILNSINTKDKHLIINELEHFFKKQEFFISPEQQNLKSLYLYLIKYPKDALDIIFLMNFFLGPNLISLLRKKIN